MIITHPHKNAVQFPMVCLVDAFDKFSTNKEGCQKLCTSRPQLPNYDRGPYISIFEKQYTLAI